jgi:hypothetical protein
LPTPTPFADDFYEYLQAGGFLAVVLTKDDLKYEFHLWAADANVGGDTWSKVWQALLSADRLWLSVDDGESIVWAPTDGVGIDVGSGGGGTGAGGGGGTIESSSTSYLMHQVAHDLAQFIRSKRPVELTLPAVKLGDFYAVSWGRSCKRVN